MVVLFLSADWFLERSFLLCQRTESCLSELLVFSRVLCTEGAVLNSKPTETVEAPTLRSESIRVSLIRLHPPLSCLDPISSVSQAPPHLLKLGSSAKSPIYLLPFVSGTDSS